MDMLMTGILRVCAYPPGTPVQSTLVYHSSKRTCVLRLSHSSQ